VVGCKEVDVWVCGDGRNCGTGTDKLSSRLDLIGEWRTVDYGSTEK
jgi:hypothetical protein